MNTHSHTADCRTELFCTHAALCGASREVCAALMNAATTDACLELLDSAGLRAPVLESLLRAVQLHLDRRACGARPCCRKPTASFMRAVWSTRLCWGWRSRSAPFS